MPNVNPWDYAEKSGKEHAHQTALFMWANMAQRFGLTAADLKDAYIKAGVAQELLAARGDIIPQLKWLHAIHNQGRDPGQAGRIRGAIAKAEGVKAGVFDIFLPVPIRLAGAFNGALPAQHYHGFYLEMKVGNNQMSAEQAEFAADMTKFGYACECAWGWLEARKKLLTYLGYPANS